MKIVKITTVKGTSYPVAAEDRDVLSEANLPVTHFPAGTLSAFTASADRMNVEVQHTPWEGPGNLMQRVLSAWIRSVNKDQSIRSLVRFNPDFLDGIRSGELRTIDLILQEPGSDEEPVTDADEITAALLSRASLKRPAPAPEASSQSFEDLKLRVDSHLENLRFRLGRYQLRFRVTRTNNLERQFTRFQVAIEHDSSLPNSRFYEPKPVDPYLKVTQSNDPNRLELYLSPNARLVFSIVPYPTGENGVQGFQYFFEELIGQEWRSPASLRRTFPVDRISPASLTSAAKFFTALAESRNPQNRK